MGHLVRTTQLLSTLDSDKFSFKIYGELKSIPHWIDKFDYEIIQYDLFDYEVLNKYDLIIFDEAALADGKDAFNVALRPTLDKINSKAVFISTPRGRNNWFADFYHRGFSEEFQDWASIRATYHENPRFSDDDIKEAKKAMSSAEFAQEYMADFNTYEGQVWNFNFAFNTQ